MWFKENKWLLTALLIGGVIRMLALILFFPGFQSDPDAYKQIAVNLRTQGVYGQAFGKPSSEPKVALQPTAFRPPLYPVVLAVMVSENDHGQPFVSALGIAAFHWLLGVLTILLAFQVGRNFQLPAARCLAIAMIVACDPIGLRQASLPMTETMATFFATFGIWALTCQRPPSRVYFLLTGILCGVSALCRPTFVIWSGLIFLAIAFGWRQPAAKDHRAAKDQDAAKEQGKAKETTTRISSCLLFFLGVACALAPWTLRNYQVFGKPIFATTHGGYTIYLGNNDSFYDYLKSGRAGVWDGETELSPIVQDIRQKSLQQTVDQDWIVDEIKKDRLYYQRAMDTITDRPGDFLYASWIRLVRFWSILPNSHDDDLAGSAGFRRQLIRFGSAAWYGIIFVFALTGLAKVVWRMRTGDPSAFQLGSRLLPAILLVVAFQGLHLLYWSNMRMRAPLVVVIALLAVFCCWQTPTEAGERIDPKKEK